MKFASFNLDFDKLAEELNAYLFEELENGHVFRNAREAATCYCHEHVARRLGQHHWDLLPPDHQEARIQAYELAFGVVLDKDIWRLAQRYFYSRNFRHMVLELVKERLGAA